MSCWYFSDVHVFEMDLETYDWYCNQAHRLYQMDNHYIHCNEIVHQCTVHFHIETYSKDTLCQLGPHLFVHRFLDWQQFFAFVCSESVAFLRICIFDFRNEWTWMKMNKWELNNYTSLHWTHCEPMTRLKMMQHEENEKIYNSQICKCGCTYGRIAHQSNHGNRISHHNRLMNGCNHRCYISIHLDGNHLQRNTFFSNGNYSLLYKDLHEVGSAFGEFLMVVVHSTFFHEEAIPYDFLSLPMNAYDFTW